MPDLKIRKRSVLIAGHATSVSLEEAFWEALKEITEAKGLSLNALITEIDAERSGDTQGKLSGANLSSAIRVYVLKNASNN